jgi:hypothetical protein
VAGGWQSRAAQDLLNGYCHPWDKTCAAAVLLQVRRFEHEDDWSRALVSYDLALQNLEAPAAGAGQHGGPLSRPAALPAPQAGAGIGAATLPRSEFEGVSHAAAVSGLLRSLHQLGAGYLLGALQARAAAVPAAHAATATAAAAAAANLGQWGALPSSPNAGASLSQAPAAPSSTLALAFGTEDGVSGSSAASFDASLGAAIAALASGSAGRCKQAVWRASRELVSGLVGASLEAAANVNAALVQLQMMQVGCPLCLHLFFIYLFFGAGPVSGALGMGQAWV